MAIYPAGVWKRLPGSEPAIVPRTAIFHTMVGTLPGTDAFFRSGRSGGIESTFGLGGPWEGAQYDGLVWQWRDTEEQADANLKANAFANSIEMSDGGNPNNPLSAKQLDAAVDLGRWLASKHPIPRRVCPAWDQGGFGWHVMFGAPGPWTPVSKECPGRVRIAQLKTIVFPAIFSGTSLQEDDLYDQAAEDRLFARIEASERRTARYVDHGDAESTGSDDHHERIRGDLAKLAGAVADLTTLVKGLTLSGGSLSGPVHVEGVLDLQPVPPE